MNSRERVIESLNCRKPDRIPRALAFFPQTLEAITPQDPETYFDLDIEYVEFNPPQGQDGFLEYLRGLPPDVHVGNQSQLTTYHEWQYHPERGEDHPLSKLTSIAAIKEFVWPDITHRNRHRGLTRKVAALHAKGRAVAGSPPHLGGELFEMAYRLRGFNRFLVDLSMRKDLAHFLLDQLTEMMIHNALILARAGVDVLLLDDDIGMPTGLMISLATWREFFKPRLKQVIQIVREETPELLVFYHSDGNFTQLVPDLVEIGVNVINPLQPDCMNAGSIKDAFGERLAMWGTVGTATAWDNGAPEAIAAEVRRRIQRLGPAGLLLAPAYDIDFAPIENITAFVEAADRYGRVG